MKMLVIFGVMFVISVQPMMVISSLILIVLAYSFYLYWILSSFWFSYMLVLVLMSGVLVIFMYMMSILPNESFELSGLVLMVFSFVLLYWENFYSDFFQNLSLGSMKIWESVTMLSSLFLVSYLLFMMLVVVWVGVMERGAIRIF